MELCVFLYTKAGSLQGDVNPETLKLKFKILFRNFKDVLGPLSFPPSPKISLNLEPTWHYGECSDQFRKNLQPNRAESYNLDHDRMPLH